MNTPPTHQERLARAALSRLAEPGDMRFTELTTELGPVALHQHLLEQRHVNDLLQDVAMRLADAQPERELDQAAKLGIRFVIPGDDEWPPQLEDLAAAGELHERGGVPIGLWVKGPLRLDRLAGSVAVVGSRSSTTYGDSVAGEIGAVAARGGSPVISGAAFGIDQAAHRGAIAMAGPTVAVLACGADRVYPEAHAGLIGHIAATGAVVSEAPLGCAPQRVRFLARNRLIAALARGTVIVEAAVRSGALNTANWANRLNRVVLGTPGPVTSASSAGVHQLIRTGGAGLVANGAEVLEALGTSGQHLLEDPRGPETARDGLSVRHRQVLDAVPVSSGARSDSVARAAGLGIVEVRRSLSYLQGRGLVERSDDGWRLAALAHT
ncbi:MAG: DNA-processing protein DprA [Actinomycetota bacterium]|nr:DNA-processing protein DprA [Actinomycetota bacterium]